jgi:hypothetical protein
MQTFLTIPSTDFSKTAKTLDKLRLNKQALEAWQIMMTNLSLDPDNNHRKPKGWYNHPAVLMWKGHEVTLYFYIKAMTDEWIERGYKTTILDKAKSTIEHAQVNGMIHTSEFPYWMKNKRLYKQIVSSHRIALLNKDYEWYRQFNWTEDTGIKPDEYTYVWFE